MYADDTQIYILFSPEHASSAVSIIESCIKDVFSWLVANKLIRIIIIINFIHPHGGIVTCMQNRNEKIKLITPYTYVICNN